MKEFHISLLPEFSHLCPGFRGVALTARVSNHTDGAALWEEIDAFTQRITSCSRLDEVKEQPAIKATREAYKLFGKDPGRYRPSAEALRRRLLRGLPLYRISPLVDLINLLSLESGYSIGGFDASLISGKDLTLGVGKSGELFEAIGRGMLNVEGLPIYRDALGGIGTPTSDNERTKISPQTTHLLVIINGYDGGVGLEAAVDRLTGLLTQYAEAKEIAVTVFGA